MTDQSNPVANEVSMAGAISLAAVMMYFSARTFLPIIKVRKTGEEYGTRMVNNPK